LSAGSEKYPQAKECLQRIEDEDGDAYGEMDRSPRRCPHLDLPRNEVGAADRQHQDRARGKMQGVAQDMPMVNVRQAGSGKEPQESHAGQERASLPVASDRQGGERAAGEPLPSDDKAEPSLANEECHYDDVVCAVQKLQVVHDPPSLLSVIIDDYLGITHMQMLQEPT